MLLNALFPTRDIGTDPAKIRDWAQAAEGLGYHCIEVADHVFGAAPRGDWKPTYSEHDPFHETFTTMAFIAAVTRKVQLCSGVLILPQRQAGLVAKQAAQVDVLSGGRVRLGVGVGWNHVEYEALGTEWKTRGARQAEQIEVMRRLWTEPVVDFAGKWVKFETMRLDPKPIQKPHVPIIVGGYAAAALRRAVRFGAGWYGFNRDPAATKAMLDQLDGAFAKAGQTRGKGFEIIITPPATMPLDAMQEYAEIGVHRLVINLGSQRADRVDRRMAEIEALVKRAG